MPAASMTSPGLRYPADVAQRAWAGRRQKPSAGGWMIETVRTEEHCMHSRELTIGRTFGVTFDHGDDFFDTLVAFCEAERIRQGYIPMFLAGFEEAEIVGTSEKLEDPHAPVWSRSPWRTSKPSGAARSPMTTRTTGSHRTFTRAWASTVMVRPATPATCSPLASCSSSRCSSSRSQLRRCTASASPTCTTSQC